MADGGTLFLDEIGDMPLRLQAKILRALQNKTYYPVGSSQIKTADVRIIAATNIDLAEAVKKQRFRLDLFYRLNVLPIEMPALRERLEDLDLLVDEFIQKAGLPPECRLTKRCKEILMFYPWPGNIRELENLITRMAITQENRQALDVGDLPLKYRASGHSRLHGLHSPTFDGTYRSPAQGLPGILAREAASEDLPETNRDQRDASPHSMERAGATTALHHTPHPRKKFYLTDIIDHLTLPAAGTNLPQDLKQIEKHMIAQALAISGNNKNKAATLLGMKRTTFTEKLKKMKNS